MFAVSGYYHGTSDKSDNSTRYFERPVNNNRKGVLQETCSCVSRCVSRNMFQEINGLLSLITLQRANVFLQDTVVTS